MVKAIPEGPCECDYGDRRYPHFHCTRCEAIVSVEADVANDMMPETFECSGPRFGHSWKSRPCSCPKKCHDLTKLPIHCDECKEVK